MSVFLFQRLQDSGLLPRASLLDAFLISIQNKTSFVEELIRIDVGFASILVSIVERDGEAADDAWRPDSRLLMDLPPGICERLLAFPYRERGGHVEVVTASPADLSIGAEFEQHLGRGVKLFRGGLQGLLAAAGAAVNFDALSRHLHPSLHAPEDAPLPLVRKSQGRERYRERTPTAPGIGGDVSSSSQSFLPKNAARLRLAAPAWTGAEERLRDACNLQELAVALGTVLPQPSLVFELRAGQLTLRSASGPAAYGKVTVSLSDNSALNSAVEEGSYWGVWYPCDVHAAFAASFGEGALVRIVRIGALDLGLVVAMVGDTDPRESAVIFEQARTTWARVVEQVLA